LTVSTTRKVRTHISGDSLDVRSSAGGGVVVDDLVAGEEGQGVGVVGKGVHGSKDVLEVLGVVRDKGRSTVEGVERGVDIENEVNASIGQSAHAGIMVGAVVNGVDADRVDSQFLELDNISCAGGFVCDGIDKVGGSSRLVIDTTDVETVAPLEEGWQMLAVDNTCR